MEGLKYQLCFLVQVKQVMKVPINTVQGAIDRTSSLNQQSSHGQYPHPQLLKMICSHQKSTPFSVQFLYGPAEISLKTMLFLRIKSPSLGEWMPWENPSQDARMLLDACKSLRSRRSQELCDDTNSPGNDLHVYVRNIIHVLSYDTVLMLALMT